MGVESRRARFAPGGFIDLESIDENCDRAQFVTDGFGRVLSMLVPELGHPDPVPVQQFGYDSAGHRDLGGVAHAGHRLRCESDATADASDSNLLLYEYDYDLAGRVTEQTQHRLETGETLIKTY